MYVGSTVQVARGKYIYCVGTIISIAEDLVALIEVDDELTISCDVSDLYTLME